ncbi:hypothetical protein DJ75_04285, partial [Halorubrum sp. Eb13]
MSDTVRRVDGVAAILFSRLSAIDLASLSESRWANVATSDATLRVTTTRPIRGDPNRVRRLSENLYRVA